MMAPKTYAELRGLTMDQLVELYDQNTEHVIIGLDYLRQELALREQEAQTGTIVRLTWAIAAMTLVVTVATIANLWFFVRR